MNWRDEPYSSGNCQSNRKKYQLVLMDTEGKIVLGRIFDSWDEVLEANLEQGDKFYFKGRLAVRA